MMQFLIMPAGALLGATGEAPDNKGILMLIIITLALFIGVAVYFLEHKKKTTPFHGGKPDDGQIHDDVI